MRSGGRAIVVTSTLPGLPDHETDADGIEIYRLPVFAVMGGRFPVLRPGRALRALTRQLWQHKIDFCVIQTRMYVQSLWAAWAAKRRGIPALVIDHSTGYMPVGGGLVGLAGRVYEQTVCRLIRAAGHPFYGVSAAVCRWLRSFGITAAGCLPNAVDPAALDAEAGQDPLDWRAALGLAPSTRLVAFVGRLIPEKGAAAPGRSRGRPAGHGAGGPGYRPPRKTACARPGRMCRGRSAMRALCSCCARQTGYCLPTRYAEGFPTTLLEAAACGCPIVCTPTAGTEELLPGPNTARCWPIRGPKPSAPRCKPCWTTPRPRAAGPRPPARGWRPTLHGTPCLLQ